MLKVFNEYELITNNLKNKRIITNKMEHFQDRLVLQFYIWIEKKKLLVHCIQSHTTEIKEEKLIKFKGVIQSNNNERKMKCFKDIVHQVGSLALLKGYLCFDMKHYGTNVL